MCRMPRLLATSALLALTVLGGAVHAADDKSAPAKASPAAQAAAAAPKPASAQERIEAQPESEAQAQQIAANSVNLAPSRPSTNWGALPWA